MVTVKKKAHAGKNRQEQELVTLVNKVSDFVAANQKVFMIVLSLAAVLVLGFAALSFKRSMDEQKAGPLFSAAYDVYAMPAGPSPEYERALGLFREVYKKYPSSRSGSLAHYYIANTLMDMGKLDEALKEYQSVSAEQAGDKFLLGLVYGRMGYLYRALGKQQDAIQAFERSESLNGEGIATVELARLYEAAGNEAEAQKKYKLVSDKLAGTPLAMEAAGKVQKIAAPPSGTPGKTEKNDSKQGN